MATYITTTRFKKGVVVKKTSESYSKKGSSKKVEEYPQKEIGKKVSKSSGIRKSIRQFVSRRIRPIPLPSLIKNRMVVRLRKPKEKEENIHRL